MSLDYVKLMIGVDDDKVVAIYESMIERLLLKLRPLILTEVPDELDHILDEATIVRYNQIGSEGMSQETVEGRSATYVQDPFNIYSSEIDQYVRDNYTEGEDNGVTVRFL